MVCEDVEVSVLKISSLGHKFFPSIREDRFCAELLEASVKPITAASATCRWMATDGLTLEEAVRNILRLCYSQRQKIRLRLGL